jgi:hypothetical protein
MSRVRIVAVHFTPQKVTEFLGITLPCIQARVDPTTRCLSRNESHLMMKRETRLAQAVKAMDLFNMPREVAHAGLEGTGDPVMGDWPLLYREPDQTFERRVGLTFSITPVIIKSA